MAIINSFLTQFAYFELFSTFLDGDFRVVTKTVQSLDKGRFHFVSFACFVLRESGHAPSTCSVF